MAAALIVRFRPTGPWRPGPGNGSRESVDRVLHSDSLFSAVTLAMRDLGWLDAWIPAMTAETPAVRLTSCYPYSARRLFVQPPRSIWPPAQGAKVRWKSARFVPTSVVGTLLKGEELKEEQWVVDPLSGCLLPIDRGNPLAPPFRVTRRSMAAVDRLTGSSGEPHAVSCLEFSRNAGMWFAAVFRDEESRDLWGDRIRSAARLIADSGIGGKRSIGWGRSAAPEFEPAEFPTFLTAGPQQANGGERAWWMVSLFSAAPADQVDWSRGNYEVVTRAGRSSSGALKPPAQMVSEGSVVLSPSEPAGVVTNVAVEGVQHPVYRSGLAVAVPVAWHESQRLSWLAKERAVAPEPVPAPVEEPPAPAGEAFVYETGPEPEPTAEEPAPAEPAVETPGPEPEPVQSDAQPEPSAEEPVPAEPAVEEGQPTIQTGPEPESTVEEPPASSTPAEEPGPEPAPTQFPAQPEPPVEEPPSGEPPFEPPPPSEPPVEEPGPDPAPIETGNEEERP